MIITFLISLVPLFYPISASSNPKNLNTLQKCYEIFSSKKSKSDKRADEILESLFSISIIDKDKEIKNLQHGNAQPVLKRLFSDKWKEKREEKWKITERIIRGIGKKIKLENNKVHQLLAEEFLKLSKMEDEDWKYSTQKALVFTLADILPKDAKTLHLLVKSLIYLREKKYFTVK